MKREMKEWLGKANFEQSLRKERIWKRKKDGGKMWAIDGKKKERKKQKRKKKETRKKDKEN